MEDTTHPDSPTLIASVTYVSASPRMCGLTSADTSLVRLVPPDNSCLLIDGGSNICVTGDANLLVDSVDIPPVTISVALEGGPSSFDDTITKRGLLPLTVLDGTMYFQPCYYCANMVETIISPAAVLAPWISSTSGLRSGARTPLLLEASRLQAAMVVSP